MLSQQKELYRLYKEIDTICRKHGIEYYLAGGTCIGALRHKGFLPWDDDMDLYMTRKNWEKFIEVSKYDFPENRVLLCPELVPGYTNLFGRYCDVTTTALHRHNMYAKNNEDDPCGYIIDILPLDPVPYSEAFMEEYAQKLCILSEILNSVGNYGVRWLVKPGKYIRYLWRALWNREKVIKELFDELFCYEEEDCDYYAMRWGGIPLLFPKEWFQKPTECLYEDTIAMMPTMNNAYLTMHYGDGWCYLPRVTEQEGHVDIHRRDISYVQFRKEYETIIKPHQRICAELIVILYRIFSMTRAPKANAADMKRLNAEGQKLLAVSGAQSADRLGELRNMLRRVALNEIEAVIGHFVKKQLSAQYIGRDSFDNILRFNHPVLVDMSDEFFEFLVRYCMYSNRIWASVRLIGIKEKKDGISAAVKELKEDLLFFRAAVNDYDLKNPAASYDKALQLAEKYPDWDALIKLRLRLILYKGQGSAGDAEPLLRLAHTLYPADGEFRKYQLDFDRSTGKNFSLEETLQINAAVVNTTRNGIIHLAVSEEMDEKFPEYVDEICGFIHSGNYAEAAAWLKTCHLLYKNEHLEKIMLLQTELDILLAEQSAAENAEVGFETKQRKLKYLEGKICTAEFAQEAWTDLYCRTLERSGYSSNAVHALLTLHRLADDYAAIASAEKTLPDSKEADMLFVHGRYLYALGKTGKAMEQYQKANAASAEHAFLNYQVQRNLSSDIKHGNFRGIGGVN